MNQRERNAADGFKTRAAGRLLLDRIENAVRTGMADMIGVNKRGISFWIEWKHLDSWPARNDTLPLRGAFEKGQLSFLRERDCWGVHAFVLIKVGSEFYLFNAQAPLKESNAEELKHMALERGRDEIIEYLEDLDA